MFSFQSVFRVILGRVNEVNENTQQVETAAERPVLQAVCDSSLKADFMIRLAECGFRHQTEALLMLVRDFVAGRIKYRGGVLQSQEKNGEKLDS